jgi:RimJ/RimL family protein N-acetyltransferase
MTAIVAPTLSDGVVGLRGMRQSDIPAIVTACQDPEISRWTRVPRPYTAEDAQRFLAVSATEAAAGEGIALAVADDDDRLVGTMGLFGLDGQSRGEIGYWTAAAARGQGVTTRAVVLMRDWAHAELGLRTIEILCHRDNQPSQRVAERAGFAHTGEIRSAPHMPPGRREGYKAYRWVAPPADS